MSGFALLYDLTQWIALQPTHPEHAFQVLWITKQASTYIQLWEPGGRPRVPVCYCLQHNSSKHMLVHALRPGVSSSFAYGD
jgi:hypothetical protein